MPSAAPFTMPANSASQELSAIVFCVVDQCLTVRAPRMPTPPRVDRRARRHPATSASAKIQIPTPSSCQGKS
eukprot:14784557-Alexandrium_andersonii.AAC.1